MVKILAIYLFVTSSALSQNNQKSILFRLTVSLRTRFLMRRPLVEAVVLICIECGERLVMEGVVVCGCMVSTFPLFFNSRFELMLV